MKYIDFNNNRLGNPSGYNGDMYVYVIICIFQMGINSEYRLSTDVLIVLYYNVVSRYCGSNTLHRVVLLFNR